MKVVETEMDEAAVALAVVMENVWAATVIVPCAVAVPHSPVAVTV
jgi:hypothetical protein